MDDFPTQLQEFRMQAQQSLLDERERQLLQAQQAEARRVEASGQSPVQGAGRRGGMNDTSLTQLDANEEIVSIAELEKQAILNTIRQLNGDKLMAARLLQIGKTTLYRKLKEYGISDGLEGMN